MSLGITSNNTQQSGLSLGVSGMQNGYQQNGMMGAQNNFMNGMMGGMGVNQQYYNAPVAFAVAQQQMQAMGQQKNLEVPKVNFYPSTHPDPRKLGS